ncbi:MAG: NfeD family protein [Beijerinckiaceae bacterium]
MSLMPAFWLWLAGGILLVGLEVVMPGVFLLWIGLAAVSTGVISWLFSPGLVAQLLIFAVFGLASIAVGSMIQKRQKDEKTDAPFLNDRAGSMLGKVYRLETAIVSGIGSIRIGDTVWRVMGADAAVGTNVRITGIEGGDLRVERSAD